MSYGWDKKPTGKGGSGFGGKRENVFFEMKKSGKYKVRFVGEPKFFKSTYIQGKGYFTIPESYVERMEALDMKIDDMVAYNVIDRNDQAKRLEEGKSTRFKVFAKKTSVFNPVMLYFEETQVNPGGQQGSDWTIIADIPEDPAKKRNTKYNFINLPKNTPFTDEEKSVLRRADRFGKNVKEEFKNLPVGERGVVDLDILYNEEKAAKKLDELFAELHGKLTPSSTTEKSDSFDDEEETTGTPESSNETPAATTDDSDFDNLF